MKLELPDDNATVLYHMGTALRNIAIDNGHVVVETLSLTTTDNSSKSLDELANSMGIVRQQADEPVVTPPEAIDHIGNADDNPMSDVAETNDTIDVNGLPWDQRIHSRGKTRNADDTWRNARKPKDKTDEEWAVYVEEVETELKALMEIPVASGESLDELAVADTISAEQAFSTPPVVTETPPVVTETPPVVTETPPVVTETPPVVTETPPVVTETPPVVTETPPVVTETPPVVAEPSVKTFPELMKFITSNNKVLDKDKVNEVLSGNGLASITLLAARADLIPQIHAALLKVVNS